MPELQNNEVRNKLGVLSVKFYIGPGAGTAKLQMQDEGTDWEDIEGTDVSATKGFELKINGGKIRPVMTGDAKCFVELL